jgi:hypothetical protein
VTGEESLAMKVLAQIRFLFSFIPLGSTALGEPWPPLQPVSTALHTTALGEPWPPLQPVSLHCSLSLIFSFHPFRDFFIYVKLTCCSVDIFFFIIMKFSLLRELREHTRKIISSVVLSTDQGKGTLEVTVNCFVLTRKEQKSYFPLCYSFIGY